jgi:deazaflavin-dependent oxidoreductase (nitroreductase family)
MTGTYLPSPIHSVRAEVEQLERTGRTVDGRAVVVLSTVGARTGAVRKTPLMRVEHAGTYAAVASMAGSDEHPRWYSNALAHPAAQLLDGGRLHAVTAREADDAERAAWWSRACTVFPSYATYQGRTRRRIPVLLLEPELVPRVTP